MTYPTFESRYGRAGAAQAEPGLAPQGAAGADPNQPEEAVKNPWAEVQPEAQANPWSQKLDPWAAAMNAPEQNQAGKK